MSDRLINTLERIAELEKWKDKSWNMHQEMAQEILPNQLEILEERIEKLEKNADVRYEHIRRLNEQISELKDKLDQKDDDSPINPNTKIYIMSSGKLKDGEKEPTEDPYEPIMRSECENEKQEIIEEFLIDLNSNIWIKDIIKKWEKRLKQ